MPRCCSALSLKSRCGSCRSDNQNSYSGKRRMGNSSHWSIALMETSWAGVSTTRTPAVEEISWLDPFSALWEEILIHCSVWPLLCSMEGPFLSIILLGHIWNGFWKYVLFGSAYIYIAAVCRLMDVKWLRVTWFFGFWFIDFFLTTQFP